MENKEYQNIFRNETNHFYYQSLYSLVLSLLKSRLGETGKRRRILDAGCGTGFLAQKLQELGQVWGIDMSLEALKFASFRGVNSQQGSVNQIPFGREFFDAVVSVDVLCQEGVDDKQALREFFRVLKPGGLLLLRLPANEFLRRSHDRYVHSQKRYGYKELVEMVQKAEFDVVKCSHWGLCLLGPILIKSAKERLFRPSSDRSEIGKVPFWINRLFLILLNLENLIVMRAGIPQGIGLILLAQKKRHLRDLSG